MVGPHSRGCLRCVKRKTKCDGARPHCAKCRRLSLPCPGYVRPIRFMPAVTDQSSISNGCTHCALRGVPCDRKFPICTRCISFELKCNLADVVRSWHIADDAPNLEELSKTIISKRARTDLPPYATIPTTPTILTMDTYCIIFLDKHFNYGPVSPDFEQIKLWIWNALQSPSEYPVSNSAAQSTIEGFFSNIHNDHKLKKAALISYSAAIRKLKDFFFDGQKRFSLDTLFAVVLLRIAEGCLSSDQTGWLSHTRGLKKLIEMQGPFYFRSQPARSILLWTRYALFIEAMVSGRRSFLEETEWQNILQSTDDVLSRTLRLGDIGTRMPGLVEDVNRLVVVDNGSMSAALRCQRAQDLIRSVTDQLQSMRLWWQDWLSDEGRRPKRLSRESHSSDMIWKTLPTPLPPPQPGRTEPSVLVFQNLEVAAGFCHYQALSIIALSLLNRLLLFIFSLPEHMILDDRSHSFCCATVDAQMSSLDHVRSMISHAYAIVEALPCYRLPQYRHSGAMYMCMPAYVAWQVFMSLPALSAQDDAQAAKISQWLNQILRMTAENGGFPMVENILQPRSEWSI